MWVSKLNSQYARFFSLFREIITFSAVIIYGSVYSWV